MGESLGNDDIMLGFEMGLLSQEQVVSKFQELAGRDIDVAVDRYAEFAEKLERAASGGNAQIRSMMGGPDSSSRARLIDITAESYAAASNDVKEKIRDVAMRPLLGDNFFYARLSTARMTNPYLVGDIIRKEPLFNPGAGYYEEDLLKSGDIEDPDLLQFWLNKFGYNLFAATTIALQKDNSTNVLSVMSSNEALFSDAAQVTAATHDLFAEIKLLKGSEEAKEELTKKYRSGFVGEFAVIVEQKAAEANWLPIGRSVLGLYSRQ